MTFWTFHNSKWHHQTTLFVISALQNSISTGEKLFAWLNKCLKLFMNREFLKILLADRDNIHIFSTGFLRFSNFWNKNCRKTICMEIDQMKWVELSKEKKVEAQKNCYRFFPLALPGKWNFLFKDFPFLVKILFKYNKNLYWLVIYNHCSFMRILRGTIFPLPFSTTTIHCDKKIH